MQGQLDALTDSGLKGARTHRQVAVVELHLLLGVSRLVFKKVRDPTCIERRRTADDAVHGVAQLDEVLCQVRSILPGDTCAVPSHRLGCCTDFPLFERLNK